MLARAAIDPQAAATARAAHHGATGFLAARLRAAQADGVLRARLDADYAARHLYAVVEGLRWPTLVGAHTPDQALAVHDEHLKTLFG